MRTETGSAVEVSRPQPGTSFPMTFYLYLGRPSTCARCTATRTPIPPARTSTVSIFDEPPGTFNQNTSRIAAASGTWNSGRPMADEYVSKMGHGYGKRGSGASRWRTCSGWRYRAWRRWCTAAPPCAAAPSTTTSSSTWVASRRPCGASWRWRLEDDLLPAGPLSGSARSGMPWLPTRVSVVRRPLLAA